MKKGLLLLLLCFSIVFNVLGQSKTDTDVNLRSAPSTDASILTTIPKGTKVTILEKTNDKWYHVECNGKKGYMSASALDGKSKQEEKSNSSSNESSKNNTNNSNSSKKSKKSNSSNETGATKHTFGAGLRLGLPTGITLKYMTGKLAFEFQGGFMPNAAGGYYSGYHNGKYKNNYNGYYYDSYYVNRMNSLLFNVQYQSPIDKLPELEWFAGGGIQVNFVEFRSNNYWYNGYYGYDSFIETNVGLNIHGGAEYFFMKKLKLPLSAFVELGTYIEMAQYPGSAFITGGTGARYWFK